MNKRDIEFSKSTGVEIVRELAFRTMLHIREIEDNGSEEDVDEATHKLFDEMSVAAANVGLESKLSPDSLINLVLDVPFNTVLLAAIQQNGEGGADATMFAHLLTHNLILDIMMLATVRMKHLKEEGGLSEQEEATLTELSKQWDNQEEG